MLQVIFFFFKMGLVDEDLLLHNCKKRLAEQMNRFFYLTKSILRF